MPAPPTRWACRDSLPRRGRLAGSADAASVGQSGACISRRDSLRGLRVHGSRPRTGTGSTGLRGCRRRRTRSGPRWATLADWAVTENRLTVGPAVMDDTSCRRFFLEPSGPLQRQYEALRAVFIDGLSQKEVADRFGYSYDAFRQLIHQFRQG